MQFVAIVLLSILAAVTYGVLHDQVTARISLEYFTIGHPPIFHTESPTLLGLGWGVVATWWVGAMMGIPLACAARLGCRPKRSASSLVRPLATLFAVAAACAAIASVIGYAVASSGAMQLAEFLAVQMPPDRHTPFLIAGWMHTASYAAGFIGGMVLILLTWQSRNRLPPAKRIDP